MTQQIINTGSGPNAQDGDNLYVAFTKVNENFSNIWAQGPVDSNIVVQNNDIISTDVNGNIVLLPNGIGSILLKNSTYPGANNAYFLGDHSRRWRGVWVGSAGINTTGNLYAGNLIISGNTSFDGDIEFAGNVLIDKNLHTIGNITTDSNVNIAGSLTSGPATFAGNVAITGNLQVAGNIVYIDVEELRVNDPVIELGTGINGAPLTSSDGFSRGVLMDYFDTAANTQQYGFMGLAGPNYTNYQFLTNATDVGNTFTGTPANVDLGNLYAAGQVSADGNIYGGNIVTVGDVSATANITGANLLTGGNISAEGGLIADTLYANTSIESDNTISAAGNITGAYLLGNGRFLSGIDTTLISNGTSRVQVVTADGNIIANVAGNTVATWTADGYSVAGNISTDSYYVGNGRYLTGVVADSIGNVIDSLSVSGNINTGNLNTGGQLSAAGNITGNYILGNGAFLTGIDTSAISNGTSNVHIATANGNITMSVDGTANVVEVSSSGAYVNGTLTVTGNAAVGSILTDGYYYANGQPLDMQQPSGSNTWVQYNDNNNFGASDAFTFDSSANALAVSGNIVGGNLRTTGQVSATGNIVGGNLRTTGAVVGGTGSFLSDVTIYGNLQVSGNIIYVDVTELRVVDPVIEMGGGPNGTPLTTNDGFSRGLKLDYYSNTANAQQFGFFGLAATDYTTYQFLTNATDTANTFTGTAANLYFGNASVTGNIAAAGILTDNYYYANGAPVDFEQPAGSNTQIQFNDNNNFGASANLTFDSSTNVLSVNGNIVGGNLNTDGVVSAGGNVYGGNISTAGNIDANVINVATANIGSITVGNVSLSGNISVEALTANLYVSANGNVIGGNLLTGGNVSATGNGTFGNLGTTGNVTANGVLTDNYYYANGAPVDWQQPSGSNTWIQYNDNNDFGASANLTFNSTTNLLDVGGNISASGTINSGNITLNNWLQTPGGTNLIVNPGTSQVRIIANTEPYHNDSWYLGADNARWSAIYGNVGNFSGTISALGTIQGGNLQTNGLISATGNITSAANIAALTFNGNLEGNYANLTGNVDASNLLTTGLISATGNLTAGNIDTLGHLGAGSADFNGDVSIVGNLNVDGNVTYIDVKDLRVEDPIIDLGGGPNGAVLTTNDGFSRGLKLEYFNTTANTAEFGFMGLAASDYTTYQLLTNATDTGNTFTGTAANLYLGNLSAVGNVAANGILTDNYYYANGAPVDFQQAAGSNTWVQYNNNNDFGASAAFTFDASSNVLTVGGNVSSTANVIGGNLVTSGNAVVSGIKTDNYMYANGQPLDMQQPAGSNTWIQFNNNNDFGATANLTFDSSTNQFYVGGVGSFAGNVIGSNLFTAGRISATGNIDGGNLSGEYIIGTLSTNAQPNITSVGTLTSLNSGAISSSGNITGVNILTGGSISAAGNVNGDFVIGNTISSVGNAHIGGDLFVNGNVTYINITDLNVQDPIISMGRGPNNTPLTVNDGYDRGEQLWYYTDQEYSAFIGWDNSTNNLIAALDVTNSSEVITVNNWGNFVVGNLYTQALNSANILFVNTGSNVVTVGSNTVTTGATFAVNATDSILIPIGNSFQRPATPVVGMIRFNTTLDTFEFYSDVDGWTVGGGGGGGASLTSQTFTADGSTTVFNLTNPSTTVDSMVQINGVTQVPTAAYSIVGNTLTFTEAPEAGDTIEVREIVAQSTVHAITNSSGNASISVNDASSSVTLQGILQLNPTTQPGSPQEGMVYFDSGTKKLRCYDGTVWQDLF